MDVSFRFPVYGFKGATESSHHHGLSGYAGICIGDPEIGDLTISEMSPEEIRAELKRWEKGWKFLEVIFFWIGLDFKWWSNSWKVLMLEYED